MIANLRGRLTYANVTATLALFIALGGSSYAALRLPRDSVGAAQIRAAAVGSSEIHNRSVRSSDLSVSARNALRGARGPIGPAGPQGPAGAAAARFFAAVTANGDMPRGNATSIAHPAAGSGVYTVGFAEGVGSCAFTATLGATDGSSVPAGRITVRDEGGRVGVQTYDASGSPADLPFHVIVAC